MANDKLSSQQQRFVEAFDDNATQAAIAAIYSPKTAEAQNHSLLRSVNIARAIRRIFGQLNRNNFYNLFKGSHC